MTVATRAWSDPTYKTKLLSDPYAALAEHGIRVPSGITVNVIENTVGIVNAVLPVAPDGFRELSLSELENVAAAGPTIDTVLKSSW